METVIVGGGLVIFGLWLWHGRRARGDGRRRDVSVLEAGALADPNAPRRAVYPKGRGKRRRR